MKSRLAIAFAAATLAVVALAGCTAGMNGSGTDGSGATDSGTGSTTGSTGGSDYGAKAPAATDGGSLMTADSPLGQIVVDGKGMTVYVFDKDTKGTATSACTGDCLTNWPIVTADSATPTVDGVTGTVGTITSPDGKLQVTLDGWPLYYYAGDDAAGATNGQGVGGIWWVVSPTGAKITG